MLIQGTLRGPGVRRRRGSERLLSQVRDVWPEQLSPWWSLSEQLGKTDPLIQPHTHHVPAAGVTSSVDRWQ